MVIPYEKISEEALKGLIEEFILREGTDYGVTEYTLSQKFDHVMKQLMAKKILVVFDPETETTSLVLKDRQTEAIS